MQGPAARPTYAHMEAEHEVEVWGRTARVTVVQRAQTVWAATGQYLGRPLEARARNPRAALNLWRKQAQAQGDGEPIEPRLAALILDLAGAGFTPDALEAFATGAADAFARGAVAHLPERRRRLGIALRLNEAALTPDQRARVIAAITSFGDG